MSDRLTLPEVLRVYVGFDEREEVVYHTFCSSVLRYASQPVSFVPLTRGCWPDGFDGQRDGSNAFIYTRFLVPWLSGYRGWALYADGDMVVRGDIASLFHLGALGYDVMVAKHEYRTKAKQKYLGNANADYPRKNWSSVILWDCESWPNRKLTPRYVAEHDGAHLHRFGWLEDRRIGELPLAWNWLVGEYERNDDAKLLHYTLGAPCFPEYAGCEQASAWHEARVLASRPL